VKGFFANLYQLRIKDVSLCKHTSVFILNNLCCTNFLFICLSVEYYSKLSPEKRLSKLKVIDRDIMPSSNPMYEHKCFYDEDVYKVEYEDGEIDWVNVREIYRKI